MNRISVTDAATFAGIPREKARYWSTLLDLEMIKDGRVSYLPAGSESLLLVMAQAVKNGQAPAVAAAEAKTTYAPPSPMVQPESGSDIAARLEQLEKSVLMLAESNKKLSEDNSKLAALVLAQNKKLDFLSEKLLPAPKNEPVKVWQPAKKTEVKVPLLKRLFFEIFSPERLRATP